MHLSSITSKISCNQNSHDASCKCMNTIIQSLKSFAYGYSFKTILAILFNLKNIKKHPTLLFKLLVRKEQINAGLFLGSYCLGMRMLNILLTKYINHPKFNSFLSGFIGGVISMPFIDKDIRGVFALYCCTRAFDMYFSAHIKKRWFSNFKYDYTLILCCLLYFMGYFFAHEPGIMPKSIVRFYVTMAREHENDRILHQIWVHKTNNELIKMNIPPQDPFQILYAKK